MQARFVIIFLACVLYIRVNTVHKRVLGLMSKSRPGGSTFSLVRPNLIDTTTPTP